MGIWEIEKLRFLWYMHHWYFLVFLALLAVGIVRLASWLDRRAERRRPFLVPRRKIRQD